MKNILLCALLIIAFLQFSFTNKNVEQSQNESITNFGSFIYFDSIEGGTLDPEHLNWSDVHEMSGGFQYMNGVEEFKKLSVTLNRDKGTPLLHQKSLENNEFDSIKIEKFRIGRSGVPYLDLRIKLEQVHISYIELGTENLVRVDMVPQRILHTYYYLDAKGDPQNEYQFGWDYSIGQEWNGE